MAESDRQRTYWDANLDAQNLGGAKSDSQESLLQELKFSSVPDIQEMILHLAPSPDKRILEIGSGLGANAVLLGGRGAIVIATDISHERLATLKTRTQNLPGTFTGKILAVKARAEALPFRDNILDGACSRAVLIHTDLPKACEEVSRVLRPGAPIAFSEPMAHNPLVKIYRATFAPKEWRNITTYFTMKEITTVAGYFGPVLTKQYYALAFLAFVFQYAISSPSWFYKSLEILTMTDHKIARAWPRFSRYSWFVLITGKNRE